MRLLLPYLLSAVLAAGLAPATTAEEPMLNITQVETLPYGAPVYGFSTLDPSGPRRFEGRFLSVMYNANGSGHDWIAVTLDDLPVIAAGQSGSPVYVDIQGVRNKIGTLSFGDNWARNPIPYLTPILEVLNVQKNDASATASVKPGTDSANLLSMMRKTLPASNPLLMMLDQNVTSGVVARGTPAPVIAGSVLGVQLAWGDFDLTSYGTVSHVDGDKVFMFGHPFLQLGPAEYRLVPMKVLTVQQKYDRSYIVAVPLQNAAAVGVITQDRETGIYGVLGREPQTAIPVSIDLLTSAGQHKVFNFFSVAEPSIAPIIIGSGVSTAIKAWSREMGDMTLFVNGKLEVEGVGDIDFSDSFTSITGADGLSPFAMLKDKTDSVLSNRFTKARIKKVSVSVKVFDEYRTLSIDSVSLDRPNFKPGETLSLRITLSQPLKDAKTVTLDIPLPFDLQYGVGKIVVGDAGAVDAIEGGGSTVVNLASLAESLSAKRRPDAVYIYMVLPPSKVGPPSTDKSVPMQVGDIAAEVKKTSKRLSSNVEEYQVVVGDFQVSGRKEVEFKVGTAGTMPPGHP
ncbi:MAG: hypothetical protein AAB375_00555 [Patescibacteria group bacterium]